MIKELAEKHNLAGSIEELEQISCLCSQGLENGSAEGMGVSKVGGFPHVDQNFIWPQYLGKPLEFIAQINLNELKNASFPTSGLLLFFYADGFWADKKEQKDFIRVVYIKEVRDLEVLEPPYKHKQRLWGLLKPQVIPKVYKEYAIKFRKVESLPDLENDKRFPCLSKYSGDDDLSDSYCNLKSEITDEGILQIGGFPNPVQYDGIAEDSSSIMKKGSGVDWVLLLQVESKLDFMWGDAGRLYFYIHKDDLAEEKFSDVWMEFQCH